MRDCPAENEAAGFQPDDLVDAGPGVGVQHLVDCHAKAARIGKEGGDIAEHDPFVWEVDDGADIVLDGFHGVSLG